MRSLQENLLRTLDRTAGWAGFGHGPLRADVLMAEALDRAGRTQFADSSFVYPLQRLLDAYEREADLSVFGHYATRFDVLRSLSNLLRFDAAEEGDPTITARPIARPVFITGLPRSGTTFLHTLLAQDPDNAVPRSWQLVYPYPNGAPDRRQEKVERQMRFFLHLSPGLDGMHPLHADAPQECTDITAQVFQSLRFDTTHHIPSYQCWIDGYGHREAFGFHRRFLQHMDAQAPGKRWVLKCPDHVFTLDAIGDVYPDARIVMLHRNPLEVLGSVATLTDLLRRPFTRHVDRMQIGRQVSERWAEGAERMVALLTHPSKLPVLHLHYREVVSAPMQVVRAVYRHCGMPLSANAIAGMNTYLNRAPRGGYGEHHYNLSDYGLDAEKLRDVFTPYMKAFAMMPEGRGVQWREDAA